MRRSLALFLLGGIFAWAQTSPATAAWSARLRARQVQVSAGLWDLETGRRLDGDHPERSLIPASTTKVPATYALLKLLKPETTLETEVWGDLQNGVVRGPLVLKGGGDPRFTSERVYMMAQELKARGVQRIEGGIVLDQSAFDGQRYGDGWGNTTSDATPPILPLSVNFNRAENGRISHDPEPLARATLARILQESGIPVADGKVPGGPPQKLLALTSAPLRDLVRDINKWSNNFMVEMLVKRLGDGRWQPGLARIHAFYAQELGLGQDQLSLTDGSGLSKDNRLSASALASILRAGWHDFEVGPEFVDSLKIIGGEPWALRMKDPDLARRVRCKTGYLSGVHTVCGYLQTSSGKVRAFAILLNGRRAQEADLWNLVKRWAGPPPEAGTRPAPGR